jgi:hypothetical protein
MNYPRRVLKLLRQRNARIVQPTLIDEINDAIRLKGQSIVGIVSMMARSESGSSITGEGNTMASATIACPLGVRSQEF